MMERGQGLWTSIYRPFDSKLFSKLADSHPDLPVFIVNHAYGALFADPPALGHETGAKIGRVLTSIVGCGLSESTDRSRTSGYQPCVWIEEGVRGSELQGEGRVEVQGGEWLASEEGNVWLLEAVDRIVDALGEGKGSSFAPGTEKAKL